MRKIKKKKKIEYDRDDERTLGEDILDFIKVFAISALVILLFMHFIAYPVTVSGRSMVPTLQNGEYGFTNIINLAFKEPARGDIVVVNMYNEDTQQNEKWVKRIIGLPGETIECKNEIIYINGKALDESSYISSSYRQKMIDEYGYFNMDFSVVKLGKNQYFVMGDNRPYSKDSRYKDVGPITKSQIFGDGIFVIWPLSVFGGK